MKKVCIVTASRSEYGLLRWVIDGFYKSSDVELQLVVTGSHLSLEQGETWHHIIDDGYPIAAKVDMKLCSETKKAIVESMGRCSIGFANIFSSLTPDIIVVLGDRYELLPICNAALVMNIPIAHISGGDITLGAIDNEVRNAITMMSKLHFPGVDDSAKNIIRMRGSNENVYVVGEPGLDNIRKTKLMDRQELADSLKICPLNRWVLVTLHPETQESLEYNLKMAYSIKKLCDSLKDVSIIVTFSNADFAGTQINEYWEKSLCYDPKYTLIPSLGQLRYLSFLNQSYAVIGNSSSGIVEAPSLGIPVINVGNRQKGRYLCRNVFQVENDEIAIFDAWNSIEQSRSRFTDNYYGDGFASDRIVATIINFLKTK